MQPPSTPAQRAALEGFIARRFERAYGARLTQFLPNLLGLRDDGGEWQAAVGYAGAGAGPLFLEQYLDAPVEQVLAHALERPVARSRIVEVGNFAAARAGSSRRSPGGCASSASSSRCSRRRASCATPSCASSSDQERLRYSAPQ